MRETRHRLRRIPRRPDVEQIHFIGKDIVYFHTLFWPAMLKFAGAPYKVPDNVYVHGFINAAGEKMSKSRGTGISPDVYLDLGLNPEWLRYYIAAKLNGRVEDIDFNPDDFVARVNSDLIGKYVNIASRAAPFLTRHFDGVLATPAETADERSNRLTIAQVDAETARANYEAREYSRVLRDAMRIADRINEAFDAAQPWQLAKEPAQRDALQTIASQSLQGFQQLTVMLAPVLPKLASRVARELFGMDRDFIWSDAWKSPERVRPFRHLMQRIDSKQVDTLLEGPKAALTPGPSPAGRGRRHSPLSPGGERVRVRGRRDDSTISIDDFAKVDLRIARIVERGAASTAQTSCSSSRSISARRRRAPSSPASRPTYDPNS